MLFNNESKDKSEQLGRIALELHTPEQILQAMVRQERRPRPELETEVVSPRDSTEELLAQIFVDELGLDHIGVEDNFFKLGGSSLMIVRIASRIRDVLGVELPMQAFFQSPTIAGLSISILQSRYKQLGDDERGRLLEMLDQLSDDEVEAMLEKSESGLADIRSSFSQLLGSHSGLTVPGAEESHPKDTVERYRGASLECIFLEDDRHWVYSWDSRKVGIVDSATINLLRESSKFKKVDDLLSSFVKGSGEAAEKVEAKIAELIDWGFLVSETGTISRLMQASQPSSTLKISTLACVSCDRPMAAERALSSYIHHCRNFGKSPRFVMMDDSSEPKTRVEYRQMLLSLKDKFQAKIYYGGVDEKRLFLHQLATRAALPADTLEFALFGFSKEKIASSGRNRNALLLETLDEGAFSVDDDTVCKITVASEHRAGLCLLSGADANGRDPSDVWSLHDRESSINLPPPVEVDLLDLHEQFLGREVSGCVSSAFGKEKIEIEKTGACLPN